MKHADVWPLPWGPGIVRRLPHPMVGNYLFHIPNGGGRSKVEAAILKGMGLRAGVSDLLLALPVQSSARRYHGATRFFGGLYIEMKAPGETPTGLQVAFMHTMEAVGYETALCESLPDFVSIVSQYLECALPVTLS